MIDRPSLVIDRRSRPIQAIQSLPDANHSVSSVKDFDPPLTLQHLPGGVRLAVYLRPSSLLQGGQGQQELFRASGASGEWFAAQIRGRIFADLSEIEELLLGWILGPAGESPKFVCRFLRRPELSNELLDSRLGPMFRPGTGGAWRESADSAIWLTDVRTVVIVPLELSGEIREAAASPLPTDLGVEEVLQRTSSMDHLVIVGVPHDLRIHRTQLADPCFYRGWDSLLDFLEQEHQHAEAFAFSTRWLSSGTHMTLRLKGSNTAKMLNVKSIIENRLTKISGEAQAALSADHLSKGFLSIARRFPSMLQAVRESAEFEISGRQVVVSADLPERALPNLLLGGLLLWRNAEFVSAQSLHATNTSPPAIGPAKDQKPQGIADLLQKRIDVDFRREPLEGALNTVADDIGCRIEIDGEALKLAGYTRNMPLTMRFERYPAGGILQKIVEPFDQLVFSVIEGTPQVLLLTTKEGAAQKQLKSFRLEIRETPLSP